MYWLLNPRVLIGLALVGFLGFTHFASYRTGKAVAMAAWNKEKAELTAKIVAAEQAARAKEKQLLLQRQQVEKRYVEEKRKAAAAAADAQSALDGLRDTLAARDRELATADSAASGRVNAGAGLERELLGSCAKALVDLAGEADVLEARIVGLQSYVKQVCLKQ